MANKLQQYFPMIRTKEEVLAEIYRKKKLNDIYDSWTKTEQENFLDICTGVRGAKMLYDGFFKEVTNPEYDPSRLSEFISLILGKEVKVLKMLPGDSVRLGDETSLLYMDAVVELVDGSIANVEIQKISYYFPGERSACYGSDLLLRQYKRIRSDVGRRFSYSMMKPVYVIVLFENSPKELKDYPQNYKHHAQQKWDTGLNVNLLQEYYYIPLDIFKKIQHNKDTIDGKLEAWLVFLAFDEPEMIEKLILEYPEFRKMYEEIYEMCRNMEKVMELHSKELREMDRNTVLYMIEDMKEQLARQKEEFARRDEEMVRQSEQMARQNEEMMRQSEEMIRQSEEITHQKKEIEERDTIIAQQKLVLEEMQKRIDELEKQNGNIK